MIQIIQSILMLFVLSQIMQAKEVRLTSLEWPPYTGNALPDQGASAHVAKAAFAEMGYELKIDFYPWKRAISLATIDADYDGYFPEYYSKGIEQNFVFSRRMGDSPLGFMELKNQPIKWEKLEDLKSYVIGIVQRYVNTAKFDQMVAEEKLKADPVVNDVTNIKKILKNRLKLAVIDEYVMKYLLTQELKMDLAQAPIQFNQRLLDSKGLFICFRDGNRGREMKEIFDEGLTKIDYKKLQEEYFKKYGFQ